MHNVLRTPPPPKKNPILKTNMLNFENGIKLLIFHVAIKFIRNSLKDKVLVQWYQICAMYTMFLVCINWYTYSCAKTFTPLRKTFFDSNVSLIHVNCLICKSKLLYIDICLYICSLYPVQYYLSNKIIKRKKFSSLYELNLLGQDLLFFCCQYNK